MRPYLNRLGGIPFVLVGNGLLVLGVLALSHIVNNFWPFDVARLDLVRATALDRIDAAAILEAANGELLLAFLASVMVAATGLVLPFSYYLNRHFNEEAPQALVVLRQALWVGLWLAFCLWLQMNRTLGVAVLGLVAAVLVIFELLLQVRARALDILE